MPEIKTFIITCPTCAQKNRALVGKDSRCGRCKRQFTRDELVQACMSASIFANLGGDINSIEWREEDGTLRHEIKREA
jgi:hypothetical protein